MISRRAQKRKNQKEEKTKDEKTARRRLSLNTWERIEAAAVATVIGPHYSSAQDLVSNIRRLSVAKVAKNIVENAKGAVPDTIEYEFDKSLVTNLTSVVSGMNTDRAKYLVKSLITDSVVFQPVNMIVLIYIFAGVIEGGGIGVDDIIECMKARERNVARKRQLDSEIIKLSKEDKVMANNLVSLRASSEFRSGVFNGKEVEEIEKDIEERAEFKRQEKENKEKLSEYPYLEDVPKELNKLFAVAESEEYVDRSGRREEVDDTRGTENVELKTKALVKILNGDFTLERAKFKHGLTAMHIAAYKNDYCLINLLKERGNSIDERDIFEKLPQDYTRDARSLEALGLLKKGGNKHCELRSTLQRRIMQNVNFYVESSLVGGGGRRGRALKYDMFNKVLYVVFDDDTADDNVSGGETGVEKRDGDEKITVTDIFQLKMRRCHEDCSEPQQKLFEDIKECVNSFRREEAKKLSKIIVHNVIIVSFDHVLDFIAQFQSEAYEEIEQEVIYEISSKEASEDMAEAQRELERQKEELRLARIAEEKRKEEEKERAMRFRETVKQFSASFVNPLVEKATPWVAKLLFHFNKFDIDGNGALSAMETIAALRTMGITKEIQQNSSGIQELITRFRRMTGEMTLKQFIFDLPSEVYDGIKRSVAGETNGIGGHKMISRQSSSKRNVRFNLSERNRTGSMRGLNVDITSSAEGEKKVSDMKNPEEGVLRVHRVCKATLSKAGSITFRNEFAGVVSLL